ncbi:MAG TPA: hypothetical protein VH743_04570 [Beijerinckiaceae bacterium]|jgi:hypothetical protein
MAAHNLPTPPHSLATPALADPLRDALLAVAALAKDLACGRHGFSQSMTDDAWIAARFRDADETLARFWAAIVADGCVAADSDDAEAALRRQARSNADADTPNLRADVATSYRRAAGY